MEENVHLHAPANLLSRKASLVPTEYEDGWAHLGAVEKEQTLATAQNQTAVLGRVASSLVAKHSVQITLFYSKRLQSRWPQDGAPSCCLTYRSASSATPLVRLLSMLTRLRAVRLENRGSIPNRKDDLSRFYSSWPCHVSVYVIPVRDKVALRQAFFPCQYHST